MECGMWTSGVHDPDFAVQSGRILRFFGIGSDIVSLSTGSGSGYPNEIRCGHAKNLDVE